MKMVSITLCIVLVISAALIGARPMDSDEAKMENVFGKIYKTYKMPQVVTPGFGITINGTLGNDTTKTNADLTVYLTNDQNTESCRIDLKNNFLEVSPAVPSTVPESMEIESELIDPLGFSLNVLARQNIDGEDFLAVSYTGMNDEIICKIKHLSDLDYIVVKEGVKNIKNILFEFQKYFDN